MTELRARGRHRAPVIQRRCVGYFIDCEPDTRVSGNPVGGTFLSRLALIGVLLFAAFPAHAQPPNRQQQKCSNALGRAGAGLARTLGKELERCVAGLDVAAADSFADLEACMGADTKGLLDAARSRVEAAALRCHDLPDFEPASSGAVQAALSLDVLPWRAMLGPQLAGAESAGMQRCRRTGVRAMARLLSAMFVHVSRCVRTGAADGSIESAAGVADCVASLPSANRPVALGRRFSTRIARDCVGDVSSQSLPGSCADTSPDALGSCLDAAVRCSLCRGVVSGYGLDLVCSDVDAACQAAVPTGCPVATLLRVRAGTDSTGVASATSIAAGWTGHAHARDVPAGSVLPLELDCSGATPPCGVCAVTGVATDTAFFGPPRPVNDGGTPFCLSAELDRDVTGTLDVETGAVELTLHTTERRYGGISPLQPCPVCVGTCALRPSATCETDADCADSTGPCTLDGPSDGSRDGVCTGGAGHGLACDVHGIDATWGSTSLDCLPSPGDRLAGSSYALTLSTSSTSLPFVVPCDFDGTALCPCGVCTGDPFVPCAGDATCEALGLGTCTAQGVASWALPNSCADQTCRPLPNEAGLGLCDAGPTDRYCDGVTRADGTGFLPCASNGDCIAVDPAFGNCTLTEARSCFTDSIEVTGFADPIDPVLVGTTCVAPVGAAGYDAALGLPGPMRVVLDVQRTDIF